MENRYVIVLNRNDIKKFIEANRLIPEQEKIEITDISILGDDQDHIRIEIQNNDKRDD